MEPGSISVRSVETAAIAPAYPGTPIGSFEFVSAFSRARGYPLAAPLNVPIALATKDFAGRKIWKGVSTPLCNLPARVFAKSASVYKGFSGVVRAQDIPSIVREHGLLDLSEEVEFGDEWRAFVHLGRLVGLHCYSGLFERVPSRQFIDISIEVMGKTMPSLRSYTLDVGFIGASEAVVEVHPFVACGLYGFRDYRVLLSMFEHGYKAFCEV